MKQMIEQKVDTTTDSDVRDALQTVWNKTKIEQIQQKGTKKRTFIDFY